MWPATWRCQMQGNGGSGCGTLSYLSTSLDSAHLPHSEVVPCLPRLYPFVCLFPLGGLGMLPSADFLSLVGGNPIHQLPFGMWSYPIRAD
jgi:hypothetical protein